MTVMTKVNATGNPMDVMRNKACLTGNKSNLLGFLTTTKCASVDVTIVDDFDILLPDTGERPALVRAAGPLTLALLGIGLALLGWSALRKQEASQ
jgi:hypothetical protein